MFFRALTMFRFPSSMDLTDLDACLSECALKAVGPLELCTVGFVPPFGHHGSAMSHGCGKAIWLTVGMEERLLPAAVVNKVLGDRLQAIKEREGRMPGGRARRRLKDDLIGELLPRSHVRATRVDALLDMHRNVIAVDTSSRRTAEMVVSEIRRALGSFPALPINAEVAPRAILTGWVAGDARPNGLELAEDCTLQDPTDTGAKVKVYRVDLGSDEIEKHLETGRQITCLSLTLHDSVAFDIDERLIVRKFKLLDGAIDRLENTERSDIAAELDARFALMAGEFGRLLGVLEAAFKISRADA